VPYLSRASLVDYLVEDLKQKQSSAEQAMKESGEGLIGALVQSGIISIERKGKGGIGYLVIDPVQASSMMISRKEKPNGSGP
jgi:hypothetical protein